MYILRMGNTAIMTMAMMRSGVCNLQVYDQAEARMQKLQHNIDNMKAEERDILLKVAALKRLREVKLSSDTMKKIFYYGYIPGEITKTTGVGKVVGNDCNCSSNNNDAIVAVNVVF